MNAPGAGRNLSLQALRGLAACSVMLYHAAYWTGSRTGTTWLVGIFGGQFGFYGVLVFFVLSGFLMEAAVRRYDARTFLLHRFVRLYPTYWLLFLCVFLVQSTRMSAWQPIPWSALSLLPLGVMERPLAVEWTLPYEVFFYMVCALLCFVRRAYLAVHLVWLAIVAVTVFHFGKIDLHAQPTLLQMPFSTWSVAFIFGGLAAHLNRTLKALDPAAFLLGGLALLGLGQLWAEGANIFLLAPGAACIVIALARTKSSDSPGLAMRTLFLLGECSYGLYLIHSMGIQIALQYVPPTAAPGAVFVGMLGVGLTLGLIAGGGDVLLYRQLKAWVDRRVRGRTPDRSATAPTSAT
jgi:peptidoglycan/LPS O-acetylase OafA/YrhL